MIYLTMMYIGVLSNFIFILVKDNGFSYPFFKYHLKPHVFGENTQPIDDPLKRNQKLIIYNHHGFLNIYS